MPRGRPKKSYTYTKEYLIDKIKESVNLLGHTPSRTEMDKLSGFPGRTVYQKRFGSWRLALESAEISCEHFHKTGGFIRGARGFWGPTCSRKPAKTINKLRNPNSPATLKTRFEILHRDNFTCQYCGRTVEDGAKLVVDHVIPFSKGGRTVSDNLITSCFECNVGKNDIILINHLKNKRPS